MLDLEKSNCLDYVPGPEKKIWKRLICTANGPETMFWLQGKKNKLTSFYKFRAPWLYKLHQTLRIPIQMVLT